MLLELAALKCHNQFGYKNDRTTDLCIFILKYVTIHFSSRDSPVFICYLDASKAFDCIHFGFLFDTLLSRGMPALIGCLLVFWYTHQQVF